MKMEIAATVMNVVTQFGTRRDQLLPIIQAISTQFGYIPKESVDELAAKLNMHRVEIEDMISFYSFFSREPRGAFHIRLSRTPISLMHGAERIAAAFAQATGCDVGKTSDDGMFTLEWASDIGMSDQEPAALVNGTVLTRLEVTDVPGIVAALRQRGAHKLSRFMSLVDTSCPLPNSTIRPSLIRSGPILFGPFQTGDGLRAALRRSPEDVIHLISEAKLRGRGGAGFPTGMKWNLCRQSPGHNHYIICNADEGEPGAFKDRVLLTDSPDLVIEGMTIGGYALGGTEGIVYLRAEYAYLWQSLQEVLMRRRREGLLGNNICGRSDFSFDIRIQLAAGAYICGEESALIESLEGKRGAPRTRPPFPTEHGYLQQPTSVNNVETLACVTRICEKGGEWFAGFGTRESTGTKLLSVSGDCGRPGVYEVPFGLTVNDLLDLVEASDAAAVQVGGPSGQCVAPKDFGRRICYEDLPSVGATMVFGPQRDLLQIVRQFAQFFAHESCGWCVPCRVGTTLLTMKLDKILDDKGTQSDVDELYRLSKTVARTSRCGLGQTAPNPILNTLRSFPHLYEARLQPQGFVPLFELEKSLQVAVAVQGRSPTLKEVDT